MDIKVIAADMVAMTKAGDFHIGEKYWADDVVSIEAMEGPMARLEGKAAALGKTRCGVTPTKSTAAKHSGRSSTVTRSRFAGQWT